MTQHCPYDEKLLDYLYEELGPEEAKDFSEHLAGCARCQAALEKLGGVRRAFRELPPPALEEDSLQRMTAQILAQAQPPAKKPQEKAPGKDKANVQTLGSTKDLPSAEVGKVLPFRRKGWKGVLFHPASGVVAAAAMALVFVVVKGWQGGPILPTVVEKAAPPGAIRPEPAAASAPSPKKEAAKEAPATGAAQPLAEDEVPSGAFGAAKGEGARPTGGVAAAPAPPAREVYAEEKAQKKAKVAFGRDDGYEPPKSAAGGLRGKADDMDKLLGGAAPTEEKVPAPTPAAPERERAAAKDAEQRPVPFEALKPQAAAPAAPPPPPAQAPAAPSREVPRPSEQQVAPEITEEQERLRQQLSSIQRNDLNRATSGGRRAAAAAESPAPDASSPQALLAQVREQLKRGQCREASESLARLEHGFPDFPVPADERAATRTCLLRQNTNQGQLNNQGPLQLDESAGDLAAKPRAKPAPASQDYRRATKRSAPAKAKPSAPAL